jgi:hypothetical protein
VIKALILYGYNVKKQRKLIDSLFWSYVIDHMFTRAISEIFGGIALNDKKHLQNLLSFLNLSSKRPDSCVEVFHGFCSLFCMLNSVDLCHGTPGFGTVQNKTRWRDRTC